MSYENIYSLFALLFSTSHYFLCYFDFFNLPTFSQRSAPSTHLKQKE